jgi:hypothetical protein
MSNTFTQTGDTAHAATLLNLQSGNSYHYFVRCRDAAGNTNADDFPIAFSIAADLPPPLQPFSFYREAESGYRYNVARGVEWNTAFSNKYVYYSSASRPGSVTFSVNIEVAGNYVIWGRVRAPSSTADTWQLQVDEQPSVPYHSSAGAPQPGWRWTRVDSSTAGPHLFSLSQGAHTIVFHAVDLNADLDGFVLTNVLGFTPTDLQLTPSP